MGKYLSSPIGPDPLIKDSAVVSRSLPPSRFSRRLPVRHDNLDGLSLVLCGDTKSLGDLG